MRRFGLPLIAILSLAAVAAAQTPPERTKEQAARELITITGADKLALQVLDQMIPALKQAIPDLGDDFWLEVRASIDPEALISLTVPAYTKHFSLEELDGLIAFYKTPLGQKVVSTMPEVMRETMAAGQAWGEQLGKDAWDRARQYKSRHKQGS